MPYGFGAIIQLLHQSAVLLTPRGIIICCSCKSSNSSLHGSCNAYAAHLDGAWVGFAPSLTCIEAVPL